MPISKFRVCLPQTMFHVEGFRSQRGHSQLSDLAHAIRVVDDFIGSAAATANPAAGIEEGISLVTGLQLHRDTELVLRWRRGVGNGRILQLLQNVLGTGAPTKRVDGDVGWWFVLGLEKILSIDTRR